MAKGGRLKSQEYINTIIPYITGCSRSLVCIIVLLKLVQDLLVVGSGFLFVVVVVTSIEWRDRTELAGDGLGLVGGARDGVGGGDRVDASPEPVGLSNLWS